MGDRTDAIKEAGLGPKAGLRTGFLKMAELVFVKACKTEHCGGFW